MKIKLDEQMNAYVVIDENTKEKRVAEKKDWFDIVECSHIHVLFGVPLCGFANNESINICSICIDSSKTKCPFGYKKDRKIVLTEDL